MALIECPKCGNIISDKSAFCSHCGLSLGDAGVEYEVRKSISETKPQKKEAAESTSQSGAERPVAVLAIASVVSLLAVLVSVLASVFNDAFSMLGVLSGLVFVVSLAAFLMTSRLYESDSEKQSRKQESQAARQYGEAVKYSDYRFACPMCGSKKVKRIGTGNRIVSVAGAGLASGKIGKQYKCDECKHMW